MEDLAEKIADIVKIQTDIKNKGIPFRIVMKYSNKNSQK